MSNIDSLNSTRTLLCDTGSVLAQQAEALFARQWPGFELDQSDVEGANLPPILVVLESGTLIAALAFCRYEDPQQPKQVIWINALYVIDEWRRCGVAKTPARTRSRPREYSTAISSLRLHQRPSIILVHGMAKPVLRDRIRSPRYGV
ncbi:GNAT family N-acetyltransferase [Vibrio sinaloensis]|nr:GNAT family N-acetyltransferase [Vibrio sinaloensis]